MRDLILNNFRWKAISLVLAVIVWIVIKYDAPAAHTYTIEFTVPVFALADPSERRVWHFSPAETHVRIRAAIGVDVGSDDIVAFVNLAGLPLGAEPSQSRKIRVDVPTGVEVVRVEPGSVMAQYSTLPADFRTNRLNSP